MSKLSSSIKTRWVEQIKQRRIERGETQLVCSAKSGMSQQHWGAIESGRISPKIETLERMGLAVGLRAEVVLERIIWGDKP